MCGVYGVWLGVRAHSHALHVGSVGGVRWCYVLEGLVSHLRCVDSHCGVTSCVGVGFEGRLSHCSVRIHTTAWRGDVCIHTVLLARKGGSWPSGNCEGQAVSHGVDHWS